MSARPFTEQEYTRLLAYFTAKNMTRNRALLVAGCGCGYRITEWLSVTVGHVWSGTEVLRELTIARRHLKGGHGAYKRSVKSRRVPLSENVRAAIADHLKTIGVDNPSRPLFSTARKNAGGMERTQAFRMLVAACKACGIATSRVSTHSLRKTFARRVYEASGKDLIVTQRLMGHTSVLTTSRYLQTDSATLDNLVLNLAA